MIHALVLFLAVVFFLVKSLDFIYLFQTKEYRLDRFFSFLNEDGVLLILYLRQMRLPARTIRNYLLVGFSLLVALFFWLVFKVESTPTILISFLLIPPLSFVSVLTATLLSDIPAMIKRNGLIDQAKEKMNNSQAVFIGITGSYGKTSTKEFLYQILSQKFKVAKTEANMNTDVGVALSIIKNLQKGTQFFIVEAGAYRQGEIKDICQLIHPKYAILTSVGNQHLSLFGSRKKLIESKKELLASIPKGGKIYINKDIAEWDKIIENLKPSICLYSDKSKTDIYAKKISFLGDSLTAIIVYGNKELAVKTNLLGGHNIVNLLPAIALALDLGMDQEQVTKAVMKINPLNAKLSLHQGIRGSIVLNDSGNSNVEGFLAAIRTANRFHQSQKIIISKGIIELGFEKTNSYLRIINELNHSDLTLFTTDKLFKELDSHHRVRLFKSEADLLEELSRTINSHTLSVIEGRFTNQFIKALICQPLN